MNPEFYEDEVIEGFYVPAMLKKAWGAQMDVLKETDAICARHDIPYFADWGTLLAAIRHSGYIPWDDDLDISMRREDYERFLSYAEKELPEGFKVMHFKNHPGHHFFVARIVGKHRICFEQDHLTRFHGFPYIAGIDLFVMDNVNTDRSLEKLKAKKAEFVITVADNIADGKTDAKQTEELIAQCEAYTGRHIDRTLSGEDLRVAMYSLAEELFAMVPEGKSDALVQMMPFGMYDHTLYIPKEYYRQTVRLPYMDTTISVPLCYDAVMRRKFGDYMVIRKNASGHDYPFYYGQHRDLLAVLDFEYPAFKTSGRDIISSKRRGESRDKDGGDIVFMPFAPKHWKYMEKLYRHYASLGDYRVHVVPIPYYYKAWDGSLADEVFDPDAYPADIRTEDYRTFDLEGMHPSAIVIQYPFDEWNPTFSVLPDFYSKRLRPLTDELIYIPFFVTDDFTVNDEREYINMDHYVCMPGPINADTVILPSDTLKKTYIEKIMEYAKTADPEAEAVLDDKIRVCPGYVYDEDDEDTPRAPSGTGKKTLIYYLSISYLAENKDRAIDKIRDNLAIFEQNADRIRVIFITQCCKETEKYLGRPLSEAFMGLKRRFSDMDGCEYIEDLPPSENRRYARMCDAYYGDPSSLALQFVYEHKPVMIQR